MLASPSISAKQMCFNGFLGRSLTSGDGIPLRSPPTGALPSVHLFLDPDRGAPSDAEHLCLLRQLVECPLEKSKYTGDGLEALAGTSYLAFSL